MTDRIHSLTVVLEHDIRSDDAEQLINAIKMIRGVIAVSGNVSDISDHIAQARARRHLGDKLLEVIYQKSN